MPCAGEVEQRLFIKMLRIRSETPGVASIKRVRSVTPLPSPLFTYEVQKLVPFLVIAL